MSLKEKLTADYKAAMKEHDAVTKNTVNLVRAAIKQYEVDQRVELNEDADIVPIIKKQLKMRQDALSDFAKAGRMDLLEAYSKEIEILKKYLPEEMSVEAIREAIAKIASDAGLERTTKNMGVLMNQAMAQLKGKADGGLVSKVVKEFLKP